MTYTNIDLATVGAFQASFEIAQGLQARALEFPDPAIVNLLQWHCIEEVQFLAATPAGFDQMGGLEHAQMLRHGLPGHVEVLTQLAQSLCVVRIEQVQQLATAGIRKCLEQEVGVVHATIMEGRENMQLFTCMS